MDSESKTGNFFDSVVSFFTGGNRTPWCERDIIDINDRVSEETHQRILRKFQGYEKEVKEISDGVFEEKQKESTMRLAWALVHSRQAEYIQRGMDMLHISLESRLRPHVDEREKLYLLAVGYYRIGDYLKSKGIVDRCIQIQPDWRQALVLKKTIKDKFLWVIITGSALGLIAAGITADLAHKKCPGSSTASFV